MDVSAKASSDWLLVASVRLACGANAMQGIDAALTSEGEADLRSVIARWQYQALDVGKARFA